MHFFSFLTAPEKVNGLNGFNFTWTEVRLIKRKIFIKTVSKGRLK